MGAPLSKEERRLWEAERLRARLCVRCPAKLPMRQILQGRTKCDDCRDYERRYSRRRYATNAGVRARLKRANKTRRKAWVGTGKCRECGRDRRNKHGSLCEKCRKRHNAAQKQRYQSQR